MIGIIDYGMGNLLSVQNALEHLGVTSKLCQNPAELAEMDKLILPGVGAFGKCLRNLRDRGFISTLNHTVLEKKTPILGICLGMQAMADTGFEGGECSGLGWIPGKVVKLTPSRDNLKVPHVGWQEVQSKKNPLFDGIPATAEFYFVHSYQVQCANKQSVAATFDYGGPVTAAIYQGNIFATQFHPEKSQEFGLRLLRNFTNWKNP